MTTTTLLISHLQRTALKAFLKTALKFIFTTILQRTKTGLHGRACESAPQTPNTGSVMQNCSSQIAVRKTEWRFSFSAVVHSIPCCTNYNTKSPLYTAQRRQKHKSVTLIIPTKISFVHFFLQNPLLNQRCETQRPYIKECKHYVQRLKSWWASSHHRLSTVFVTRKITSLRWKSSRKCGHQGPVPVYSAPL